jgi:hypothetical protein
MRQRWRHSSPLIGELVVAGVVGLINPLKPDIPETVCIARGAGVRFFVVTGPPVRVMFGPPVHVLTRRRR